MVNVLFICKHNRFRSRVASSYFNKINRNSKNIARGAGIYPDNSPLDENEVGISKIRGINIKGKPKKLNNNLLKWQDKIVIVANDVPKNKIRDYKKYNISVWKISDVDSAKDVQKAIRITINKIVVQVKKLNKELNKA
ncbi:MAG: hypothetical protein ABIE22_04810 [archaeon]